MTILQTVLSDITFFEVAVALVTVGVVERLLLRFAPDAWLDATGLTA